MATLLNVVTAHTVLGTITSPIISATTMTVSWRPLNGPHVRREVPDVSIWMHSCPSVTTHPDGEFIRVHPQCALLEGETTPARAHAGPGGPRASQNAKVMNVLFGSEL